MRPQRERSGKRTTQQRICIGRKLRPLKSLLARQRGTPCRTSTTHCFPKGPPKGKPADVKEAIRTYIRKRHGRIRAMPRLVAQASEFPALKVGKRLLQLLARVHDERAVLG